MVGFEHTNSVDLSRHLLTHYSKLYDAVINNYAQLSVECSTEFLELTKTGLERWIDAAKKGLFAWGLLHFRRPK